LWLLTLTSDCRIFNNQKIPDVIKTIFEEQQKLRSVVAFDLQGLTRTYTPWDYCVQYRETDFNFVSRLMEQEGIFYFFKHEQGKHTLVVGDSTASFKPCPGQARANLLAQVSPANTLKGDFVSDWQFAQSLRPNTFTLRDYHFEMPDDSLEVVEVTESSADRGIYDYPGEYAQRFNKPGQKAERVRDEGATVVRMRQEEEQTPKTVARGASVCRAFSAGFSFDLILADGPDKRGPYVLTQVQHSAVQSPDHFSDQAVGGQPYNNNVTCVPRTRPYRPARLTPKPVIQGLQTAEVVGDEAKEIDVDQFGRVLVQFPWDRRGKKDANGACRIRVAQPWAGNRWGAFFWPRIGQEVVVAFLEGDPEQPLIVGSVYNNIEEMPPYLGDPKTSPGLDPKHPHNPNLSGIKTCSTLGGGGFNEIRFNDTHGKEQLFIRSQGALDVRALGSHRTSVGGDKDLGVCGNSHEEVHKNKDLIVEGDMKSQIAGTYALSATKHRIVNADGATEIGSTGNYHVSSEAKILIESPTEIGLVCGGSFVTLTPEGVFINGMAVGLNSGGAPTKVDEIPDAEIPEGPKKPAAADDSVSGAPSTRPQRGPAGP
jgi:type VI secretion system secreted protein VgrG